MNPDKLKKVIPFLIVFFSIFSGTSDSSVFAQVKSSALPPQARQAVDRGLIAAGQQQWESAIKHLGEAQKTAPYSPYVLFNLALAHDSAGGHELQAIAWYRAYLASASNTTNSKRIQSRIIELENKVEVNLQKIISRVKEVSEDIKDKKLKFQIYLLISSAEGNNGDIVAAKATANDIEDPSLSSIAYELLVRAHLRAGDIDGAMNTADNIKDQYWKSSAYKLIAEAQVRAGDMDKSMATAVIMDDSFMKSQVYMSITEALIKADDIEGAKSAAMNIKDMYWKSIIIEKIVKALAKAGDIDGARELAANIDLNLKSPAYASIAEALVKANDIQGAKAIDASIDSKYLKSLSCIKIAEAQIMKGDFKGAQESISTAKSVSAGIDDNHLKFHVLKGIVEIQAKAGNPGGINEVFSLAKSTANSISNPFWKSSAYASIAELQMMIGDINGAKITASRIPDRYWKSTAYISLAEFQIRKQNFAQVREALTMANSIANILEDKSAKIEIYNKIAEAQLNAGEIVSAKTAIKAKEEFQKDLAIIDEINSWVKFALNDFSKPPLSGWQKFADSLKMEEPGLVVKSLAEAAQSMAIALRKTRENQAAWENFRKQFAW